jgi:hypothetical protein
MHNLGFYCPDVTVSLCFLQLQDIPAEHAPNADNLLPASAPVPAATAAPTVASEQHTIDVSASKPRYSSSYDDESPASWIQHLSWHPRLHLHHNLLTPQECDKMRELLARPSRTVGGANSGFGYTAEDEEAALMLMIDVEQRVANWSALPPNHLEGWQVSRVLGVRHPWGDIGGNSSCRLKISYLKFNRLTTRSCATCPTFCASGTARLHWQRCSPAHRPPH